MKKIKVANEIREDVKKENCQLYEPIYQDNHKIEFGLYSTHIVIFHDDILIALIKTPFTKNTRIEDLSRLIYYWMEGIAKQLVSLLHIKVDILLDGGYCKTISESTSHKNRGMERSESKRI